MHIYIYMHGKCVQNDNMIFAVSSVTWFPSLICKNYIFRYFVKTVEATALKFCMILKLVTLHPERTIAQVKCANFPNAHAQTFVLLKLEKWQ